MKLEFSPHPGCWERHLQRQHDNLLFAKTAEAIDQHKVDHAQQQDEDERQTFMTAFKVLLLSFGDLKAQEESQRILDLQADIDTLYADCASLGGDFHAEKAGLRKLSELIVKSILSSTDHDEETLQNLDTEHKARKMHFALLEHSLIAHILRQNSPIEQNQLVATLLSEDDSSLRAAMSLFNMEQQQTLCQIAGDLLDGLQGQGLPVDEFSSRLQIMQQPTTQPM